MKSISPAQQVMLGKWGQAVATAAVGRIMVISRVTGNFLHPIVRTFGMKIGGLFVAFWDFWYSTMANL